MGPGGLTGAQEFQLEGAPTAAGELSQGSNRRQASVQVSHTYGQIRRDMQGEKLSETMELLLEPRSRFLTRAHAPGTAIRLSGGDSANPTRTIGVLGNKFRTLSKTRVECYHVAGDRAWDLKVAALVFQLK